MSNESNSNVIVLPVAEFRDCSVHVAPDCLSSYALLRAAQLRMLADLLHCKTAGFGIEITDKDVPHLTCLVNQLSAETSAIVDYYALAVVDGKDGA